MYRKWFFAGMMFSLLVTAVLLRRRPLSATVAESSAHAPVEPASPPAMHLPTLLLLSAGLFMLLAVLSAANRSAASMLLWGGLALVQGGVAVRTGGLTLAELGNNLYHTLTAFLAPHWRVYPACGALLLGTIAYAASTGNQFDNTALLGWMGAMACCWLALAGDVPRLPRLSPGRETIALGIILFVGAFALFYNLDNLPRDMIADHAEYLLDALRVREGARDIYFGNNSGREPLFIYLIAAQPTTGYLSLKLVSAAAAFLTLPALYLLGREVGGRAAGLLAAGIASVSPWLLIFGRIGFRVTLAGLASALLLVALLRALRSGRRRDFVVAGLALGLGQYGYSSFRIAPLVVLLGVGLFWLQQHNRQARRDLLLNAAMMGCMALVAFIPLLSFALADPDTYWTRTHYLVGAPGLEALLHFLRSFIDSLLMFHVGNDPVPMNVLQPSAPVLTPLEGALFLLGMLAFIWRGVREKKPVGWFVPLAFLVLILPSALATGRPLETPSARRAITALPLVMLVAGYGLAFPLNILYRYSRPLAFLFGGAALAFMAVANLNHYAADYPLNYHPPPARDIAAEIRRFEQNGGSRQNVHFIYGLAEGWLDWRLVALWLDPPLLPNVLSSIHPRYCLPHGDQPSMVILAPTNRTDLMRLTDCFPDSRVLDIEIPERDWIRVVYIHAPFMLPSESANR